MPRYPEKTIISLEDSLYIYYDPDFIDKDKSDKYFNILNKNLFESQLNKSKNIFKRYIKESRMMLSFGDAELLFGFENSEYAISDWNNQTDPKLIEACGVIKEIRDKISRKTGIFYNFVLINRYKDGTQSIGPHRDKEDCIRQEYGIAGVSLGAWRQMVFKPDNFIPTGPYKDLEFTLENGSLIDIKYPTNLYWKHSIPKRLKIKKPRISLTFRKIM